MGGSNSGRWCGRPTIERTASYVLPASAIKGIPHDFRGILSAHCTFGDGFSIKLRPDAAGPGSTFFEFEHPIRAEDERVISYRVHLTQTRTRFGGQRWWWLCPRTGRRVFKLYLPLGGWQFWSRHAYCLGYACQRESRSDRLMRRARKLHRALGGDGEALGQEAPPKPKGMRWRTYERKVAAWVAAEDRADGAWLESVTPLLRRLHRR